MRATRLSLRLPMYRGLARAASTFLKVLMQRKFQVFRSSLSSRPFAVSVLSFTLGFLVIVMRSLSPRGLTPVFAMHPRYRNESVQQNVKKTFSDKLE